MRAAADPRLWAILGLAALILALQLATPGLDSDQAVTGLMGVHILRGEFPIFFWRQDHAGVPESYLAAVAFSVFGISRLVLDLVPAAVALAMLLATYRLAALLFGHGAGLLALLFSAVAPPYVVAHYVLARAYYVEHLLLGQLVLLLTARLAFFGMGQGLQPEGVPRGACSLGAGGDSERSERQRGGAPMGSAVRPEAPRRDPLGPGARDRAFLVLGLVGGLGFYFGLQIVPALLTSLGVLWVKDPGLPRRRGAWLAASAFLLGSLPFWIANLTRGFATLETAARFEGRWALGEALRLLWDLSEVLLGVREYMGMPMFLPRPLALLVPGLVVVALVTLLWEASRGLAGRGRGEIAWQGTLLLLIFIALMLGVVVWGRFLQVPRYLLPLYPGLAILLARFCQLLGRRSTVAAGVVAALFCASTGIALARTTTVLVADRRAEYRAQRAEEARLFDDLERAGLTRLYAFDYWLAPRLTFDARERLIVALPTGDRYPPYTAAVDAAPRAGYLFRGGVPAWLEGSVHALGARYRTTTFGGYAVAHDFSPPPSVAPLPGRGWTVEASVAPETAVKAADGDPATRWTAGQPQQPGQWLSVDLGGVVQVAGVAILPGRVEDLPRGLRVEGSLDGVTWRPLLVLPEAGGPFRFENGAVRLDPTASLTLTFPPVSVRRLRLVQTGQDPRYWWSVAELTVLVPAK